MVKILDAYRALLDVISPHLDEEGDGEEGEGEEGDARAQDKRRRVWAAFWDTQAKRDARAGKRNILLAANAAKAVLAAVEKAGKVEVKPPPPKKLRPYFKQSRIMIEKLNQYGTLHPSDDEEQWLTMVSWAVSQNDSDWRDIAWYLHDAENECFLKINGRRGTANRGTIQDRDIDGIKYEQILPGSGRFALYNEAGLPMPDEPNTTGDGKDWLE